MFEPRTLDFKPISVPFTLARRKVLCFAIVMSWNWIGFWRHCWRRHGWGACIAPIGSEIYVWNVRFDSRLLLSYFFNCLYIPRYNRNKNVCPCIVEIRGTWGCALPTFLHSATARAGSPPKAHPFLPLISTMHGQPFLIPLIQRYFCPLPSQYTNIKGKLKLLKLIWFRKYVFRICA